MRNGLIILLLFWGLAVWGQSEGRYLRIHSDSATVIHDAVVVGHGQKLHQFSNREGIAYLPQDSIHSVIVKALGHYPQLVSLMGKDTQEVFMKRIDSVRYDEGLLVEGRKKLKSIFLNSYDRIQNFHFTLVQQREMQQVAVPFEVKGVSGKLVPSEDDSGAVYSSLRLSEVYYTNASNSHEQIVGRVDSGLFKNLGFMASNELILRASEKDLYLYPLSNLLYASPLNEHHNMDYNYYLQDSIQIDGSWLYRIVFTPEGKRPQLFSGYVWIYKDKNISSEVHYTLYKENQIQFTDSLQLSFFGIQKDTTMIPVMQQHTVALNLLGYKFYLRARSVFIDFKQEEFSPSIRYNKFEAIENNPMISNDSLSTYFGMTNGGQDLMVDPTLQASFSSAQYRRDWILEKPLEGFRTVMFTGYDANFRHGYVSAHPLALSVGYNTVEGVYINPRATYHLKNNQLHLRVTPYLRYGFSSQTFYPKVESSIVFNYQDPVTLVLEGGMGVQQFNPTEPIDPLINTLYSLFLEKNYLKIYEKQYIKFLFDKELFRGLEFVMSVEAARRKALFNTTDFTIFGSGAQFTPNNPDHPPVISSENGFATHWANTLHFQLFYQFGRKYVFQDNKLIKLESSLPRVRLEYRTALDYREGMPGYDLIALGVGSKTRIKSYGVLESDLTAGGFTSKRLVQFADFKHFNGVQTAFINRTWDGWTDVRQFSTLPYYDYSTDEGFLELHIKHQFYGWLLSKIRPIQKYGLHSYAGYNYLYVSDVGNYHEFYLGVENLLKVVNIQFAGGISHENKFRFSVLLGVNFNYTFYVDSRNPTK